MAACGRVIVYGGKGALGSTIVKFFRSKSWVCVIFPEIGMYRFANEFCLRSVSMITGVARILVLMISVLKLIPSL